MAETVSRQLAAAISTDRDGQVEIRLDPPELGRVRVTLSGAEGHLSALITADRPETLDLMRRHAELLLRDLAAAGFRGADLAFAGGDGRMPERAQHHDRPDAPAAPPAPFPPAVPAAAPARTLPVRDGGLDLRL
ncbi:MAG: flagellar hook-length control protein FliK [Alphaproteobacteria bacterium]|nr:MAG: flagellar hook-length control protein FliK [Alphaproteobacteria bacterium]